MITIQEVRDLLLQASASSTASRFCSSTHPFSSIPVRRSASSGRTAPGKTTLFRMIVGEEIARRRRRVGAEEADDRLLPPGRRGDVRPLGARRGDCSAAAASATCTTSSKQLQSRDGDPARADEMDRILARFGEVQEEYEHLGGYALEAPGARSAARPRLRRRADRRRCRRSCRAGGRCASRWRACCSAGPTCC